MRIPGNGVSGVFLEMSETRLLAWTTSYVAKAEDVHISVSREPGPALA